MRPRDAAGAEGDLAAPAASSRRIVLAGRASRARATRLAVEPHLVGVVLPASSPRPRRARSAGRRRTRYARERRGSRPRRARRPAPRPSRPVRPHSARSVRGRGRARRQSISRGERARASPARAARHLACSTSPPAAITMSLTYSGGNRPWSTTPGSASRRRANSAGSSTGPVQSAMTPPSGLGGPPRGVPQPAQRRRKAERQKLERDRRPNSLHPLLARGDDDEAVGRRGDDLLARVRPPPPLTSHGPGAIWSAPSMAMSSSASSSNASTARPAARAAAAVASDVATQRTRRARSASAGMSAATVVPEPIPTRIPSSTRPAAYRAARRLSASTPAARASLATLEPCHNRRSDGEAIPAPG